MIKQILTVITLVIIFGCSDTSDCLSPSGKLVTTSKNLANFSKIIVHEGVQLELKQGIDNSIKITYGNNLIDNISTSISNGVLKLENSTCNVLRNNEPAQIVVTVTDITEIRNASQFPVSSKEILKFNAITLFSEDYYVATTNVGDFNLNIDTEALNIVSNNVSNFKIKGKTNHLFIGFYAGNGKFNGEFLKAQHVEVFHRGNNTMIVHPIEKLTGEIRGVGDLISVSKPNIIDVAEFYTGKLIFRP